MSLLFTSFLPLPVVSLDRFSHKSSSPQLLHTCDQSLEKFSLSDPLMVARFIQHCPSCHYLPDFFPRGAILTRGLHSHTRASGERHQHHWQSVSARTGGAIEPRRQLLSVRLQLFPLQTCIFSASQLFLPQTRVFLPHVFFPHRGWFFHLKVFMFPRKM